MYRVTRGCGKRKGAVPFAEHTTKVCSWDCSTKGSSYEEVCGGRGYGSRAERRAVPCVTGAAQRQPILS